MSTSERSLTLADLLGEAPKPESAKPVSDSAKPTRRRGRPVIEQPQNFTAALAQCTPVQQNFVRAIVAGLSGTDAYRSSHPSASTKTCARGATKLMHLKPVKLAIEIGRTEMAREIREATKYDLQAAHDEIDKHIRAAAASGQYSAVASLVREKLKMHKLTDSKEAVAQAGFQIVIHQPDGGKTIAGEVVQQ